MSKTKTIIFSVLPLLLLLIILEVTGRIIYPFDSDERGLVMAERDPRLELSYLSEHGDGKAILFDVHRKQSHYLPFLGWIGETDTNLPTIKTNALGFRDTPVASRKANEYRILLLGASAAWGLGASSNETTVAGKLESLLNNSGGEVVYRVMSGAYPGWQSRQELVVLMEFYDHFDPDLVLVLTGYNDLHVLTHGGTDLLMRKESQMLAKAVDESIKPMDTMPALRKVAGSLGIWRLVVYFREKIPHASGVSEALAYDEAEAARFLPRVVDRYVTMSNFAERHGIEVLIALQPDIYTTNKPFSEEEQQVKERFTEKYINISETYRSYRADALKYFSAQMPGGDSSIIDLQEIFDDTSDPVFLDDCHFNDRGYAIIAENLWNAINNDYPGL